MYMQCELLLACRFCGLHKLLVGNVELTFGQSHQGFRGAGGDRSQGLTQSDLLFSRFLDEADRLRCQRAEFFWGFDYRSGFNELGNRVEVLLEAFELGINDLLKVVNRQGVGFDDVSGELLAEVEDLGIDLIKHGNGLCELRDKAAEISSWVLLRCSISRVLVQCNIKFRSAHLELGWIHEKAG